jgi:hypothetical protein
MIIPHKEGSFTVLVPEVSRKCLYLGCHKLGDFHVFSKDDNDKIISDYPNICDMHIIHAFIDFLSDPQLIKVKF